MKTSFDIGFDLLKIYSSTPPRIPALQKLNIINKPQSILRAQSIQRPYIFSQVAKEPQGLYEVRSNPVKVAGYVKSPPPVSILVINAGQISPAQLIAYAGFVYGDLTQLELRYFETRIDFHDVDFETIYNQLLVKGKGKHRYYQGETAYIGSSASGHQIVLYDRAKKYKRDGLPIRLEAKTWLSSSEGIPFLDFIYGAANPMRPFRDTCLIDIQCMPLKKEERISISKKGLTRFIKGLDQRRRQIILADQSIFDPNEHFSKWEEEWHQTVFSNLYVA